MNKKYLAMLFAALLLMCGCSSNLGQHILPRNTEMPAVTPIPTSNIAIVIPSPVPATAHPTPSPTLLPTLSPTTQPTAQPVQNPSVVISAVGDCTFGGDPRLGQNADYDRVFQNTAQGDYGFYFEKLQPWFAQDDLTLVNLEGTLTTQTAARNKQFTFKADPHYVKILSAGNVEMVNLANNHTLDYGERGYADTIDTLEAEGIEFTGNGVLTVFEANGIRIGLAGYSFPHSPAIEAQIEKDIAALKQEKRCDAVILSFHGGTEQSSKPTEAHKKIYRTAIDLGADLVIAHHPHILQGIEQYNGRFIAYSLGNFSFGGNRNPKEKDTVIFQQKFSLVDGVLKNDGLRVIPCLLSSNSTNNYQPIPREGDGAQKTIDLLNARSATLEYGFSVNGEWQSPQ